MRILKLSTIVKQAIFLFLLIVFVKPISAGEPDISCEDIVIASTLKPFYKSDNGALIYVRQEGSKVYWLAERFDRKFVAVFKGNYKGTEISGSYYDLAKGKAQGSGTLKVLVSNGGKTLKITGGNMDGQTLTSIACPSKFPARRKAHYRGDTTANLTGRWNASNAGQMHLSDEKGTIAGYFFGHQNGSNARPSTAKVFFGTKTKGNTEMKIEWFDLPIGLSYDNGKGKGKAAFKIVGPHALRVIDGFIPGLNHEREKADTSVILR